MYETVGVEHAVVAALDAGVIFIARDNEKGMAACTAIVIATTDRYARTGYLAAIIDGHWKEQLQTGA